MSKELPYTEPQLLEIGLHRETLPRHIAIIMDGNGRWARKRFLPRIEGHRRGVNSVRAVVEECSRLGLDQLTLYCFSSENWKRPQTELTLLMDLLKKFVIDERAEIMRQGLQFCTIGRLDRIADEIHQEVQKTIDVSQDNDGMRLCLALDYGSRAEIAEACRALARDAADGQLDPETIDESVLAARLDTKGMPDPDLVIRTAGEMRLSNFLLWQISYAELWVTETFWPDFDREHLRTALRDFAARERRFGGLVEKQSN